MITEKEILQLIDGNLGPEESAKILREIEENADLKKKYDQLVATHKMLETSPLIKPSSHFTANVMNNLSKRFAEEVKTTLWGKHMIVAVIVIAVGLVAAIALLSLPSLSGLVPQMELKEISLREQQIQFDPGSFINQDLFFRGLIYLNAFLGIFLLERAILRPFFQQRRQRMSF